MRIEGGDGEALRLVASLHDLRMVDGAFPELLANASFDDWRIRTGATRDEMVAVWAGIAGSRAEPFSGGELGWLPISERAVEVLEATLFEIARARTLPASVVEERTGTPLSEWQRLWRLAHRLVGELDLRPTPGSQPSPPAPRREGLALSHFRQVGVEIHDARIEGLAFEVGDVLRLEAERVHVRDVVGRDIRLIQSRLVDVDAEVAIRGGAVVDCDFDGVAVSGTLADLRFIGNVCTLLDLRRAILIGCRFFETSPGDQILLPDGRDCFVVSVANAMRTLEPFRGRLGERTFKALSEWLGSDEADCVSIGGPFWRNEIVERGGDPDPEVEADALDRLHRVHVASISGRSVPAADDGPNVV